MNTMDAHARKKLTVSLSDSDMALVEEIGKLTGAYTASEVVRDALRQAARIAREKAPGDTLQGIAADLDAEIRDALNGD